MSLSPKNVAVRYQMSKQALRSPNNAITQPLRYGLMPVDVVFGQVRERPERKVLLTGDSVKIESGKVVYFVGTDEQGQPILARGEKELKQKSKLLEVARVHHTT